MKLVLFYGPPAVGKLTVAEAVAALTGFKLFHNHLSVDLVESVFKRGSKSFGPLIRQIRTLVLEEAARTGIDGVVFTMVYDLSRLSIVEHYIKTVRRQGGQVCLVHLHCNRAALTERVTDEGRKQFGKVTSPELLDKILADFEDPFSPIVGHASLSVDTGNMTPDMAAEQIVKHFALDQAILDNTT